MVSIDQQSEVPSTANAIGLLGELGQSKNDEIRCSEHGKGANRPSKHTYLEAKILGNAGGNCIVYRAGVDAFVAIEKCAKPFAPFSPVHIAVSLLSVYIRCGCDAASEGARFDIAP